MKISKATKPSYLLTVSPRVCQCQLPARELFQSRNLGNVVVKGGFYWQLFLDFFGDMAPWLVFTVVDTSDGRIIWRNGRLEKEENDNG